MVQGFHDIRANDLPGAHIPHSSYNLHAHNLLEEGGGGGGGTLKQTIHDERDVIIKTTRIIFTNFLAFNFLVFSSSSIFAM